MVFPEITIPATEAKNRFGELLEAAHREPVAAVLSIEEDTSIRERLGEEKNPMDLSWLDEWRTRMDGTRGPEAIDEKDDHRHLDRKYGG